MALRADPRSSRPYFALGLLAMKAGRWAEAAERLESALALKGTQPGLAALAAEARRRARLAP